MPDTIRVAVIGAGAFGRNHLRVLHELSTTPTDLSSRPEANPEPTDLRPAAAEPPRIQLTAVVDSNPSTRDEAAARYNIPAFASVDHLLAANLDLHAATVCVPTVAHASAAEQLLTAGLDVLVEKPLTATLAEADHLIALAHRLDRILAAGHLERFNPAVTAAQARLTRPMFFEAHRLSVFTPRSLDVDVVLDLMIHDLDILLAFTNSPVSEVRAVGLPVLSRKVDIANVRLEFASGAIANLTASRVSTEQVRKLRLFQPAQYLSLDYARQELLTVNVDPALTQATKPSSRPEALSERSESMGHSGDTPAFTNARAAGTSQSAQQPHPSAGLSFAKLNPPREEPLRLELQDFLEAVATRRKPRVTAEAARAALALALDVNAAIQTHAQATGLLP